MFEKLNDCICLLDILCMDETSFTENLWSDVLHWWFFSAVLCWRGFVALLSVFGFKSGDMLGQVMVFYFFMIITVWDLLPSFLRVGDIFLVSILVNKCAFIVSSINVISPTPFPLMQPYINALSHLCFTALWSHCANQSFTLVSSHQIMHSQCSSG